MIPELLVLILEHLTTSPKQLNKAALVNKQWCQIALDVKWRCCQIKLSRVFQRLDPTMEVDWSGNNSATLTFENADVEGWRQSYLIKVTNLEVDFVLKAESIAALKQLLPEGPLCPSLKELSVDPRNNNWDEDDDGSEDDEEDDEGEENESEDDDDADTDEDEDGEEDEDDMEDIEDAKPDMWSETLKFLTTPGLKSVSIAQGHASDGQMNLYIHTVTQIASNIQSVEILTPSFTPDYAAFKNMRELSVNGWMDHDGWRSLARCEDLETMELWEAGGEPYEFEEPGDERYTMTLPKLKHLRIFDPDRLRKASFIQSLFRNTTMPMLETVRLSCTSELKIRAVAHYLKKGSPMLKSFGR